MTEGVGRRSVALEDEEKVPGDKGCQVPVDRRPRMDRKESRHGVTVEGATHHRRSLDDRAFAGAELVEPGGQQGGNRGREIRLDIEARVLGDHGQQLFEEQRVALRRAGEPLAHFGRRLVRACQVTEQDLSLTRVEG